jgi:hypothetical protein
LHRSHHKRGFYGVTSQLRSGARCCAIAPESTAHHTTNPSPPLFGILSVALCLIGIAVLGTAVLRRRAAARLGDQEARTAG